MRYVLFILILLSVACVKQVAIEKTKFFYERFREIKVDTLKYEQVNKLNDLTLKDSGSFMLPDGEYTIFKYVNLKTGMDNKFDMFWVKSYGIIYGRSYTWHSFSRLRSSNMKDNEKINNLIDYILSSRNLSKIEIN